MSQRGFFEKTEEGVPQGGPLSPLCGNVMLNELDKELERRGHRFVRYADDALIFCKSRKSAERTLKNITPFIEEKLFLRQRPLRKKQGSWKQRKRDCHQGNSGFMRITALEISRKNSTVKITKAQQAGFWK